jgi:hypothetical protein
MDTLIMYVGADEVNRVVEPYTRTGWVVAHMREAESRYEPDHSTVIRWLFVLEREPTTTTREERR